MTVVKVFKKRRYNRHTNGKFRVLYMEITGYDGIEKSKNDPYASCHTGLNSVYQTI
jgi:hypothetical protein